MTDMHAPIPVSTAHIPPPTWPDGPGAPFLCPPHGPALDSWGEEGEH